MNRSISAIFALTILSFSLVALAKGEKKLWHALVNHKIDQAIGHYSRNLGKIDLDYSEDGKNTIGSLLSEHGLIDTSEKRKPKAPSCLGVLKGHMSREKLIRASVEKFFVFAKRTDEEIARKKAALRNEKMTFLISVDQISGDKIATISRLLGIGAILLYGDFLCTVYTTQDEVMLLQEYEWVEGIDYYDSLPGACSQ